MGIVVQVVSNATPVGTVTPWSSFYAYVQPEVPTLPLPVLDHVLRKAAIEFCEETAIHAIDATPITVVADTGTYALDSGDPELDVSIVKFAWYDGKPLPFVSQEILNDQTGVYWPDQTSTAATGFTQQDHGNLILYPIPTVGVTDGLKLKLVVRPSLTSTGVYDWIANRFIQEISFGALAMATGMMPNSMPESDATAVTACKGP